MNKRIFRKIFFVCFFVFTILGYLSHQKFFLESSEALTSGDYEYTNNGDGTASLDYYMGSDTVLIIPNEIEGLTVTSIGDYFLSNYSNTLTSLTLNDSLISIGAEAFAYQDIDTLTLPTNLEIIGYSAFQESNISTLNLNLKIRVFDDYSFAYNQISGTLNFPDTLENIGQEAFSRNYISTLSLGNSILRVDNSAFYDNAINSLDLGNSIQEIGTSSFWGNNLTTLVIPNSVERIEINAFQYNDISSLTIPTGTLEYIGGGAFNSNSISIINGLPSDGIIYKRLPDTTIDTSFIVSYGGANTEIDFIPTGVITIGENAFRSCSLTSIDLPSTITTIGENAFRYNTVTSLSLPLGIQSIGISAFSNNLLTEITLPEGFDLYYSGIFAYNDITSVTFSSTITRIPSNTFYQNEISSISIPNTVTFIGNSAFGYNNLTSVTIPDSVKTIETFAFRSNQITSFTLGSDLEVLGTAAFYGNLITSLTLPIKEGFITEWTDNVGTIYYGGDTTSNILNPYTRTSITPIEYTLSYNNNLESEIIEEITGIKDEEITISTGESFSKVGYHIKDWNTQSDGSGVTYDLSSIFIMPAEDVTLYAQWEIDTYTISYNTNLGSGYIAPQTGEYSTLITLSDGKSFTKTGYTLISWNTDPSGNGTKYLPSSSFSLNTGDLILYAQWQINTYTLTFEGAGSNLPSDINAIYNSSINISTNIPTRIGFTFQNWNTKADGSGIKYLPGDSLLITKNITIYSQWKLTIVTTIQSILDPELEEEESPNTEDEETPQITEPQIEIQKEKIENQDIQINGIYQENTDEIILKPAESFEISISVEDILGNINKTNIDTVVMEISGNEYIMNLSPDRTTYSTLISAPEIKGEYTINILAQSDGETVSIKTMNVTIDESENYFDFLENINKNILIIITFVLLIIILILWLGTRKKNVSNNEQLQNFQ